MYKPKKYIIKIKEKGHWKATRWTNPEGKKYPTCEVTPVSYAEVVAALKDAQFHWPDCVYKIVEVRPKNVTKKARKTALKGLFNAL